MDPGNFIGFLGGVQRPLRPSEAGYHRHDRGQPFENQGAQIHLFWTIANDLAHAEDGAALPDSSFGSSRDISTVSGFIVSVSNSLSTEIKALVGDGDTYVTQTAAGLSSIEVDLDELANANENPLQISLEDARIKPEVRTKIDGLRADCRICIMSKIECIRKSS